jgi:hypothetical protein
VKKKEEEDEDDIKIKFNQSKIFKRGINSFEMRKGKQ